MTAVVRVVNVRTDRCDLYIGRQGGGLGTFGNKYTHLPLMRDDVVLVGSREDAIERYRRDFDRRVATDPAFQRALASVARRAVRQGGLVLGCYCAPLACHGDVLAAYLNNLIQAGGEL